MTETETHPEQPASDEMSESQSSWAVSFCFWFALLLAAAVYGTVALAPKLAVWNRVKGEYDNNIRQLGTLEEDVEYLERVEHALKTDPEFLQRLVGATRPAQPNGEELIPVSGSLLFGQSDEETKRVGVTPADSFVGNAIIQLASDTRLRTILLSTCACLTILAFTFFNEAGAGFIHSTLTLIRRVALVPTTRYFNDDSSAANAESEKTLFRNSTSDR